MPWFSGNSSTGCAWMYASISEAGAVVAARLGSRALRGRCAAVVERDTSRKVVSEWTADCVASPVAGSNSDGIFPVESPEGAILRSPSQDCQRCRCKTSSTCHNGPCQGVKECSRECLAAPCRLPGNRRTQLGTPVVNYEAPVAWSFDSAPFDGDVYLES
jgi:hypothetical protein